MMPRMTELVSWRGLMVVAVFAFGILQLVPWMRSSGREAAAQQSDCVAWDRAASEGIATLISDTSAVAELRLDEAILQLRRARKNCRSGAITLARGDYTSLHQAFPSSTGSIQTGNAHESGAASIMSLSDGADAHRSTPWLGTRTSQ